MKTQGVPQQELFSVIQNFDAPKIDDVESYLTKELEKITRRVIPGSTIAIAVGSRGIFGIDRIVQITVRSLRRKNARPFVVPAMGSHGGATAEGQKEVLSSYGVRESIIGAPIRSSMEVVRLPSDLHVKLFMDSHAFKADGIILINRIKPHTDYHGPYESGLVKMAVIGLGKHDQALEIHRFGVPGLRDLIPQCAEKIFGTGKILGGVAIVENAYEQTALIEALPAEAILSREPGLLNLARTLMPALPSDNMDLLIVDWMGKDISGAGMDTNIIGRIEIRGEREPDRPRIKAIFTRDLTAKSHGNALGVGLADVISRRLYDKIDFQSTLENAYTSSFLSRAKVPIVAESDEQAVDIALRAGGAVAQGQEKIMRIRDTLRLDEIYVSEGLLGELRSQPNIEITGRSAVLIDPTGDCPKLWQFTPGIL
jgi:hypothetical protein